MTAKTSHDTRRTRRRPARKPRAPRLKVREARFRILAERSSDILFSMRFPEARFEYLSPSVEECLGHAPEDFYADPGLLLRCVAPEWRAAVRGWLRDAAQGLDAKEQEFQVLHRSGQLRWLHLRQVLAPAPGGRGLLLQGVATDVTTLREAQQALMENEARFRTLAENSRDIFFSFALSEGRYEFVSPRVTEVLGHSPQEFYDDPGLFLRCVAPEWRETMAGWMAEAEQGRLRDAYEFAVLDGAGRRRWIKERLVLVPAAQGRGLLLQGLAADVTEERSTREALRKSEARYRELAEGWTSQALVRINLRTNRYEYVSPGMELLFGFPPEEFYSGERGLVGSTVAPEWRERVREWMAEAKDGLVRPEYEFELIDAWGRRRWVHQRCTLLSGADGAPEIVQGVLFDITDRQNLQTALADSERKYRTLHESMRDGFAIVDMDGLIVEHNSAFRDMLGYPDEEIRGLTFRDITPARWHGMEERILTEQVLARGYSDVYEKEYQRRDGTVFPVSVRTYLDAGEAGRPARFWASVRDTSEQKRTEAALHESEKRYLHIVETASEGIWAVDAEQRATFVNAAMTEMMGYTAQEMLGVRTTAFTFPEDMDFYAQRIALRRTGQDENYERRFRRKDGTVLWTLASVKALMDEAGNFDGAFAMFIDITERKRAEEVLRDSNARYALLAENLVDVVWTTDADLNWTYLSPSAARVSGIPLEELFRKRFEDVFTPESLRRIGELAALRAQGATPEERARPYRLEVDLRRADGALVPLEVMVRPTYGADGRINGYCGTSRDITERKRVEVALRRSEERYALALRGANDGIWDWDLVADTVYYSDRWKEIIGYGPDELEHNSQEWLSRIHPEDYDQVLAENGRCISGETPVFQVEYRLRHKDGSYRWIHGRGASLLDSSGRVVRMAGAHTDISARKEAEAALLKSERLGRKLLESMQEGVWAVDANRRTTFVNDRLCAMLGYSAVELMAMTPLDVLEWPQRHVADIRFYEREEGTSGATDYVLVRKDGSRFPAHVMTSPIMEGQGRFEGLVCGVVDLTQRARMEHELRRNQARFEALYELSRLMPATEHQLAAFTLHEAIRLTDSSAGVLLFVSEDGQTLVPKAWEAEGLVHVGQPPNIPASGPLPWAMVLQRGQPLLLNDFSEYADLMPPGHPAVTRFLGVPALDGARPVAVLGLTGKGGLYTAEDTLQSTLLLDGMWRVVRTRRDEEHIRTSLREKEALLHEVHHRVKNNMQVISSLLDLAGKRLASPEARLSLTEVRGKVQAMSLIHSQLHGSGNARGISLERFVRALYHQLREVYHDGLELSLWLQLGDLTLGLDQAVPLGLALNEALANVFKYACGQDRAGRVEIRAAHEESGRVTIEVRDDGPGLPKGLEPAKADSLGMKLMFGLVRHQLRGELEFADTTPGLCVRIRFLTQCAR
ncbi:MAG: PAS domain S-box protein [Proteobacteria bacterium]|nr:PAS domain S-box protein [Pseudomonadota bacterium]MBU1595414.1 PAS domain S-box protein [Pseudomonadota bacterium]